MSELLPVVVVDRLLQEAGGWVWLEDLSGYVLLDTREGPSGGGEGPPDAKLGTPWSGVVLGDSWSL